MLIDHYPLLGLRLETPRLQLRLPSDEELAALADLAAEGIHDPAVMPFEVPWTDRPPAERASSVVRYHWLRRGNATPADWCLPLAVFAAGQVVGTQEISGCDFAATRVVTTGSWLGRRYQGKGIGTEMRAAVLHLAFAGLGAEEALSAANSDNEASLGVSRKLGYQANGIERKVSRGEPAFQQRLRLTRARWERYRTLPGSVAVAITGLEPCLPEFGLAASG